MFCLKDPLAFVSESQKVMKNQGQDVTMGTGCLTALFNFHLNVMQAISDQNASPEMSPG